MLLPIIFIFVLLSFTSQSSVDAAANGLVETETSFLEAYSTFEINQVSQIQSTSTTTSGSNISLGQSHFFDLESTIIGSLDTASQVTYSNPRIEWTPTTSEALAGFRVPFISFIGTYIH